MYILGANYKQIPVILGNASYLLCHCHFFDLERLNIVLLFFFIIFIFYIRNRKIKFKKKFESHSSKKNTKKLRGFKVIAYPIKKRLYAIPSDFDSVRLLRD